jgi:hypothetical protein
MNAAPVDSEKVNERTFKGDAWIRKSWQPLLTYKKSTKTESAPTGKSSSKHLPKVTRGFGRARSPESAKRVSVSTGKSTPKHLAKVMRGFERADSPYWLRKSQRKRIWCHPVNHHRNTFQGDAWIQKSSQPWVIENGVGAGWKIVIETPVKGDAWIRKSWHPLLTQKKTTKMEWVSPGKSSPKHLPKVTRGFGSARSPCCLRKSQRNNY